MKVVTELTLFVKNQPGVLAKVCEDLRTEKINIEGMTVIDHVDHALVRMVTTDPRKTLDVLERTGVLVLPSDVLRIDLPNRPGGLEKIARRLARAKLNIDYLYGTSRGDGRARLFLRVSDPAKARRALERR